MSLQSMTGFGRAESECGSGNYKVEIKSVNNRYLDVQFRMPRVCNPFEQKVKTLLSETLIRGSVSLSINREAVEDDIIVSYDEAIASKYVSILSKISDDFKLGGKPSVSDLAPFYREFITQELAEYSEEQLWGDIESVLKDAISRILEVRVKEAEYIRIGMLKLLETIESGLEEIKTYAPARLVKARERLAKVVNDLKGEGVDESRVAFETSIMADKLDIAEEILRLSAHLVDMRDLLNSDDQVGKRMNFLLQEINREINTIGSKANDQSISSLVVDLKEATERIREQALNLV